MTTRHWTFNDLLAALKHNVGQSTMPEIAGITQIRKEIAKIVFTATLTATSHGPKYYGYPSWFTKGLHNWWTLSGPEIDVGSATVRDIRTGNWLDHSGVGTQVQVTDQAAIQNPFDDGGTVEAWIYPKSDGELSLGAVMVKSSGTDTWRLTMGNEVSGFMKVLFRYNFSTNAGTWRIDSAVIPVNTWTHLAVSFNNNSDGNVPIFYLNGVVEASSTIIAPSGTRVSDVGDDLFIGDQFSGSISFDGFYQKFYLWNHIRRAADILEGVDIPPNPEDLDRTYLSFDGVNDDVTVTDQAAIQNIFDGGGTVEAWVYVKSDGELNQGRIAEKRSAGTGWIWHVGDEASGKVKIAFFVDFSTTDGRWITTNTELTLNEWHRISVEFNADSVSNDPVFRVDAVVVAITETSTPVGTRVSDVGNDLTLGNDATTVTTFDGYINDIRLWSDIRTTSEITNHFDERLVGVHQSLAGYWRLDEGTGSTVKDSSPGGNDGTIAGATWIKGLVGKWELNEGSGTVAIDTSGNGNNGTITGATWGATTHDGTIVNDPIFNQTFDDLTKGRKRHFTTFGIGDYVHLGDITILDSATQMTWGARIRASTLALTAVKPILVSRFPNSNADKQFTFRLENAGSGLPANIVVEIATDASGNFEDGGIESVISVDTWYDVMFVYDGNESTNANKLKIYIDGVQQTLAFSGVIPTSLQTSTTNVFVGHIEDSALHDFEGDIYDVVFWSVALTAAQALDWSTDAVSDRILAEFFKAPGDFTNEVVPTLASYTQPIPRRRYHRNGYRHQITNQV